MNAPMHPGGKTVLVVDDDPLVQESLVELVQRQGYRVLTAADGGEALRVVRAERPNVILLDVAMPGMDGFHVASLIKSDPTLQQIPIVLYSGHLEESFAVLAHETRAEYFLPKPGSVKLILAAIKQLLDSTSPAT